MEAGASVQVVTPTRPQSVGTASPLVVDSGRVVQNLSKTGGNRPALGSGLKVFSPSPAQRWAKWLNDDEDFSPTPSNKQVRDPSGGKRMPAPPRDGAQSASIIDLRKVKSPSKVILANSSIGINSQPINSVRFHGLPGNTVGPQVDSNEGGDKTPDIAGRETLDDPIASLKDGPDLLGGDEGAVNNMQETVGQNEEVREIVEKLRNEYQKKMDDLWEDFKLDKGVGSTPVAAKGKADGVQSNSQTTDGKTLDKGGEDGADGSRTVKPSKLQQQAMSQPKSPRDAVRDKESFRWLKRWSSVVIEGKNDGQDTDAADKSGLDSAIQQSLETEYQRNLEALKQEYLTKVKLTAMKGYKAPPVVTAGLGTGGNQSTTPDGSGAALVPTSAQDSAELYTEKMKEVHVRYQHSLHMLNRKYDSRQRREVNRFSRRREDIGELDRLNTLHANIKKAIEEKEQDQQAGAMPGETGGVPHEGGDGTTVVAVPSTGDAIVPSAVGGGGDELADVRSPSRQSGVSLASSLGSAGFSDRLVTLRKQEMEISVKVDQQKRKMESVDDVDDDEAMDVLTLWTVDDIDIHEQRVGVERAEAYSKEVAELNALFRAAMEDAITDHQSQLKANADAGRDYLQSLNEIQDDVKESLLALFESYRSNLRTTFRGLEYLKVIKKWNNSYTRKLRAYAATHVTEKMKLELEHDALQTQLEGDKAAQGRAQRKFNADQQELVQKYQDSVHNLNVEMAQRLKDMNDICPTTFHIREGSLALSDHLDKIVEGYRREVKKLNDDQTRLVRLKGETQRYKNQLKDLTSELEKELLAEREDYNSARGSAVDVPPRELAKIDQVFQENVQAIHNQYQTKWKKVIEDYLQRLNEIEKVEKLLSQARMEGETMEHMSAFKNANAHLIKCMDGMYEDFELHLKDHLQELLLEKQKLMIANSKVGNTKTCAEKLAKVNVNFKVVYKELTRLFEKNSLHYFDDYLQGWKKGSSGYYEERKLAFSAKGDDYQIAVEIGNAAFASKLRQLLERHQEKLTLGCEEHEYRLREATVKFEVSIEKALKEALDEFQQQPQQPQQQQIPSDRDSVVSDASRTPRRGKAMSLSGPVGAGADPYLDDVSSIAADDDDEDMWSDQGDDDGGVDASAIRGKGNTQGRWDDAAGYMRSIREVTHGYLENIREAVRLYLDVKQEEEKTKEEAIRENEMFEEMTQNFNTKLSGDLREITGRFKAKTDQVVADQRKEDRRQFLLQQDRTPTPGGKWRGAARSIGAMARLFGKVKKSKEAPQTIYEERLKLMESVFVKTSSLQQIRDSVEGFVDTFEALWNDFYQMQTTVNDEYILKSNQLELDLGQYKRVMRQLKDAYHAQLRVMLQEADTGRFDDPTLLEELKAKSATGGDNLLVVPKSPDNSRPSTVAWADLKDKLRIGTSQVSQADKQRRADVKERQKKIEEAYRTLQDKIKQYEAVKLEIERDEEFYLRKRADNDSAPLVTGGGDRTITPGGRSLTPSSLPRPQRPGSKASNPVGSSVGAPSAPAAVGGSGTSPTLAGTLVTSAPVNPPKQQPPTGTTPRAIPTPDPTSGTSRAGSRSGLPTPLPMTAADLRIEELEGIREKMEASRKRYESLKTRYDALQQSQPWKDSGSLPNHLLHEKQQRQNALDEKYGESGIGSPSYQTEAELLEKEFEEKLRILRSKAKADETKVMASLKLESQKLEQLSSQYKMMEEDQDHLHRNLLQLSNLFDEIEELHDSYETLSIEQQKARQGLMSAKRGSASPKGGAGNASPDPPAGPVKFDDEVYQMKISQLRDVMDLMHPMSEQYEDLLGQLDQLRNIQTPDLPLEAKNLASREKRVGDQLETLHGNLTNLHGEYERLKREIKEIEESAQWAATVSHTNTAATPASGSGNGGDAAGAGAGVGVGVGVGGSDAGAGGEGWKDTARTPVLDSADNQYHKSLKKMNETYQELMRKKDEVARLEEELARDGDATQQGDVAGATSPRVMKEKLVEDLKRDAASLEKEYESLNQYVLSYNRLLRSQAADDDADAMASKPIRHQVINLKFSHINNKFQQKLQQLNDDYVTRLKLDVTFDLEHFQDKYDGETFQGLKHGFGKFTYANGDRYEGEWKMDVKNGRGWYRWANSGDVYEGEWLNGVFSGQGTYQWSNGNVYEGMWSEGKYHGYGRLTYPTGAYYEGEWYFGQEDGHGVWVDDNGTSRYEGEFQRGLRHGLGELRTDKSTYVGNWYYGVKEGEGKATFVDGEEYEGEYKAGVRNGEGRCKFANGNVYIGQWRYHKRCGRGEMEIKSQGSSYSGEWLDDLYHGMGKLVLRDGSSYTGEWSDGKRNGEGIAMWSNGTSYQGDFMEDVRHGHGRVAYANGDEYDGQWLEDKYHGTGRFSSHAGYVYEGEWIFGVKQGQGKCTYANGSSYEGQWRGDVRSGYGVYVFCQVLPPADWDGKTTSTVSNEYKGEWKDNRYDGRGRLQFANGDVYEGTFGKGMYEGFGVFTAESGEVYSGSWRKGVRHGQGKVVYANGDAFEGVWEEDKPLVSKASSYQPIGGRHVP